MCRRGTHLQCRLPSSGTRPMPRLRFKRYLFTGLLTFIPLWVTFVVFKFVLGMLDDIGAPLVSALLTSYSSTSPEAAAALNSSWITSVLALLLTLAVLYVLG